MSATTPNLAPARGRTGLHLGLVDGRGPDDSAPVGSLWLLAAEEASVAVRAFGELAGRLAALGAPEALSLRCRMAGRDEVRHGRSYRRMAERFGVAAPARFEAPAPAYGAAGTRTDQLVRLAVVALVDGVVGEGFTAARLEAGADAMPGPGRAILRLIAVDEAAHACLGGDIVRWCLQEAPGPVATALSVVARQITDDVVLPAAYERFASHELRRAGHVDPAGAAELWADHAATCRQWIGEVLHTAGLTPGALRAVDG